MQSILHFAGPIALPCSPEQERYQYLVSLAGIGFFVVMILTSVFAFRFLAKLHLRGVRKFLSYVAFGVVVPILCVVLPILFVFMNIPLCSNTG